MLPALCFSRAVVRWFRNGGLRQLRHCRTHQPRLPHRPWEDFFPPRLAVLAGKHTVGEELRTLFEFRLCVCIGGGIRSHAILLLHHRQDGT